MARRCPAGRGRRAAGLPALKPGDPVDRWPDAAGGKRDVAQVTPAARPSTKPADGFAAVRFDGRAAHLRWSAGGPAARAVTVFVVAAPYPNRDGFPAFVSFGAAGRNDFETGLNIDQAIGSPPRFEVVNVETAGGQGARNLAKGVSAWRRGAVMRRLRRGQGQGTVLWLLNGVRQNARDRAPARPPHGRAADRRPPLHPRRPAPAARASSTPTWPRCWCSIMSCPMLTGSRSSAIWRTNTRRCRRGRFPAAWPAAKPLVPVKDPPPVQVLVPGFTVRPLPVDLPNINNVLYRPDGTLVALGYDGRVWLLRDTDGDGLEDRATLFWDNRTGMRSPIGMALTPPGYKHGDGVFVVGKTRLVLITDTDGDGKADREITVAGPWKESFHAVDGLGVAFDRRDGSVYYGRGTYNFADPLLRDKDGKPHYARTDEAGAILRVSPDFKKREVIATGIRFPVGLRFNRHGDLFATDQEGATWVPNGNPLDELLHVQKGRHYGFPPRHPKHLPDVIDEPSTFDYGPQHQSTCGLCFNEPVRAGGPTFGPPAWAGDAFVTGYSRGKLWRTRLVKTPAGYVARSDLFACLTMLTVDACVTPDGGLLVACHSGGPDWGSGPTGKGKLYKITYADRTHPQPVLAWPAGPREVRVEFDRPIDPPLLRDVLRQTDLTAGRHVRAGDRFEVLAPGYAAVQEQKLTPRYDVPVRSAQLTPDRRTLILATDPSTAAVARALTLPGMGRPAAAKGEVVQQPAVDLDFDLSGCEATWTPAGGGAGWTGWLPHLDLQVARALTAGSGGHDALWAALTRPGELRLRAKLDLIDMLRPAVQPGSRIDYELPPETVTVAFDGPARLRLIAAGASGHALTVRPERDRPIVVELVLPTGGRPPTLGVRWTTAEDRRPRPLALHRVLVPWADTTARALTPPPVAVRPPELEGGSWARGRKEFFGEQAGCSKCHTMHGQGGDLGPDLSNLVHRDYASVLRDITSPSFAINPDHLTYVVSLTDGRILTGVVRTVGDTVRIGDTRGQVTVVRRDAVEEMRPSPVSTMPEGIPQLLGPARMRDLMAFLLTTAPALPRDYPGPRPKPRTLAEVNAVLAGAPTPPAKTRPIRVVLVAGPKDHGPGEHDYPAWQKAWAELLAADPSTEVVTAWEWPAKEEFRKADVMVLYQHGDWDARRAADVDAFLDRGGGLVYVHWAIDGRRDGREMARRTGLAALGAVRFRHGPLTLEFNRDANHPVTRNFARLALTDESYWQMAGTLGRDRVLGTAFEDGRATPQLWSLERGRGRVFVSIPGHYSWTFDDPLFRLLLLRGIAWAAKEPVDRFNDLVWPAADVAR
ncbi:MAG: ThuA domain-containing protein [Gemmataceae bacterium]